jgi:hypothetical protein
MNTYTAAFVVSLCLQGDADPGHGLEDVIRLAAEAREAALAAMPQAKGKGRYECIVRRSPDGETISERRGDWAFVFSGQKNWGMFVKSLERDYDATIYVSHPKKVMISHFSDGIRPFRAEGVIYSLPKPHLLPPELVVTPQMAMAAGVFFDQARDDKGQRRAELLGKIEGRFIMQVKNEHSVMRFQFDSSRALHLVKYERCEPDGYITSIVTKDWATTPDGLWYVREYQAEKFPIRARATYSSQRIVITSIEHELSIPPEVFTFDALALPVGSKVKDCRLKPNKIFGAPKPVTDVATLKRFFGELPGSGKN